MIIKTLSLSNFRIFRRLEIDFDRQFTLFCGDNAQGKTSLLEAVHLMSILTSPIAGNDKEMVNLASQNDATPVGRLVSVINKNGKNHNIEIRLILHKTRSGTFCLRKQVLIDGIRKKLFDAVGFFNSVLFLPQTMRIVEGSPVERRRYLDQTLSQVFPGYVKALDKFQKGVVKRNALLKQLFETGGDQNQLLYWDKMIVENAAVLIKLRNQVISELWDRVRDKYLRLTNGRETLEILYAPSFFPNRDPGPQRSIGGINIQNIEMDMDEIAEEYEKRLLKMRRDEINRGVTLIGPHRDDMVFMINGVDLGVYGSRGQIRSAIMALKFSEMEWLKEKTGETPVLLLDETLAELDKNRREDFLNVIDNNGQAILTTADLDLFSKEFISRCKVLEIKMGKINQPDLAEN